MSCRGVSKFIPLKTLEEIKENRYRTKCNLFEYESEEVDEMIILKKNQITEREIKEREKILDEWEKERLELVDFVQLLRTKGAKYLKESTLLMAVKDLEEELVNYV